MTTPLIKICGITTNDDAAAVASAGADLIGLNFWARSKRVVSLDRARDLAVRARGTAPGIGVVGLFVNADLEEIAAVVAAVGLDIIQLHGDEREADCIAVIARCGLPVWKAVPVSGPADIADLGRWPVAAVLLDAPSAGRGGSGKTIDWGLAAAAAVGGRVVLAGGLDPDNVATAVRTVRPWAVDVASGVELEPGVKDHARVAAFVAAVRGALTESGRS